ncbi:hypothetical protein ES703_49086 [subsurface metagenome]
MVQIPVILSLVDQKDLSKLMPVKEVKINIPKNRVMAIVKALILGR